ncbi:MAG: hypothetical protein ACRENX_09680 [Candidatus Dormibacteria bacterium]
MKEALVASDVADIESHASGDRNCRLSQAFSQEAYQRRRQERFDKRPLPREYPVDWEAGIGTCSIADEGINIGKYFEGCGRGALTGVICQQ